MGSYFSRLGAAFALLWIMMFTITFSDSLCSPVVPYMVREFLMEESAVVVMLGLLSFTFNLVKTAANFPGALLGDKIDRRVIVLSALAFLPTPFLLLTFAGNPSWILGAYALLGIFYGVCMPSLNAMVAASTPKEIRGMSFAIFNLSWIMSQTAAPLLGGFLSDKVYLRFPPTISLMLSLAMLAPFIVLRGFLKSAGASSFNKQVEKRSELGKPLSRTLLLLCGMQFLSGLGNGILMPVITAFLMYVIGASPTDMGLAFSLGWGVATAAAQIPGGRLSDKFGSRSIIMASTLVSAPLLTLMPLSRSLTQFILILAAICFIGNLSSPAFSAWIATLIGEYGWSKGYGLTSASFSIGSMIGPVVGSLAWTIFETNRLIPFALSALLTLLTLPFILTLKGT
ncbi:MAG: MFS transporter [Candidatus Bathyarchaeia archaeon]